MSPPAHLLPLAVLTVGPYSLAWDAAEVAHCVPTTADRAVASDAFDLSAALGVDERGIHGISPPTWHRLTLTGWKDAVLVWSAPEVRSIPSSCIQPMPALLSNESDVFGSAIDGVLGCALRAPGVARVLWLVDLARFVARLRRMQRCDSLAMRR